MATDWCSDKQESRPPSLLWTAPATRQRSSAPNWQPESAVKTLCLIHILLVHSYTSLLHNNIQRKASVHLLCWLVLVVLYFCFRHNSQNLVLGKCRTWKILQSVSAVGNLSIIPRVALCPWVPSCQAGHAGSLVPTLCRQHPRLGLDLAWPEPDEPQKTASRYSKSSFHYLYSLIRANEY